MKKSILISIAGLFIAAFIFGPFVFGQGFSTGGFQTNTYNGPFTVNMTNINWTDATNLSGYVNWYNVNLVSSSLAANWATLNGGVVNWTNMNGLSNAGINWADIVVAQKTLGLSTGINWNYLNPSTGGLNWMAIIHGNPDNKVLCTKNGQIGVCATGFSASGAGSCNCM
jgi:hypothetical protein